MTGLLEADGHNEPTVDPTLLTRLKLPAHATVWVAGRWRRGLVIARRNEPGGWMGKVRYDDDDGDEVTGWLPAERIAATDTWLTD
jgi:hypothetical protein